MNFLKRDNQFVFSCPIFEVDTKMAACLRLRDLWARGQAPTVRQGCQAALCSCKCPIIRLLQRMRRTDEDIGYYSTEPRKGRLDPKLLAEIAPVRVLESTIARYSCSDAEIALLRKSNTQVAEQIVSQAPAKARRRGATKSKPTTAPTPSATMKAAINGDMSAAVSHALQEQGASV